MVVDAHGDLGVRGRGQRGVVGARDLDEARVIDGPTLLGKEVEALGRQRLEVRELFAVQLEHLPFLPAVDARRGPALFPMGQPGVLRVERVEAFPFECRGLGVLNRILDSPLAIRIADAARIGDDAIVREHRRVDRVEGRFIEVRPQDAFFEIVEDDVLGTPAQGVEGLLMQLRPDLLIGLPHGCANTLPRILEGHHEEPRAFVRARLDERQRALAVVDLRLFAGQELQHVEALGRPRAERGDEALDRVVAGREGMGVDELLVDAHRVAAELELRLDPHPVRFARRRGARWRDRRR